MHAAIARLQAINARLNVNTLAAEAGVSLRDASPWWQAHKDEYAHGVSVRDGYQQPIIDSIGFLVTDPNWNTRGDDLEDVPKHTTIRAQPPASESRDVGACAHQNDAPLRKDAENATTASTMPPDAVGPEWEAGVS